MKKTILVLAVLACAVSSMYAELNESPRRKIEFSLEGQAAVSNNYFTTGEFLVKNVVVNLRKIADNMPSSGWSLDAAVDAKTAVNINLSEKNRFSFFMDVDGTGSGNIEKELFELIGYGNDLDKTYDITGKAFADVFWETGFSWRRKFGDKLAITFTPAVYSPLVFMKASDTSVTIRANSAGSMTAEADAKLNIYSAFPHDISSGDNYFSYLANAAGFDMSVSGEYPLYDRLDVGGYIHIPVIPGRTKYLSTSTAYANYVVNNVLSDIRKNNDLLTHDSGTKDWEYSEETKNINRPLRIGAQAAYRPFGSWLTLSPMLGYECRYPFMSEAVSSVEYNLAASVLFKNILGAHLSTGLINQVFIQEFGTMLNMRVFELDTSFSLQGRSFVNCFRGSGFGAKIGLKFGF